MLLAAAPLAADRSQLVFTDIATGNTGGTGATPAQLVTFRNTGTAPVTLGADAAAIVDDPSLAGDAAAEFEADNWPALPATVPAGGTLTFGVKFRAASVDLKGAFLRLRAGSDAATQTLSVALRGIGTASDAQGEVSGDKEPSLQRVLRAFQIPINVGDANGEETYDLPTPRPAGTVTDEIDAQRLVKAGTGPVRIDPLAAYAFNTRTGPVGHFGYYVPGTPGAKTELYAVPAAERTSTNPTWGATFDPGDAPFALYGDFNGAIFEINGLPRGVYGEDKFNTWDATNPKKVRLFPLKNPDGSAVANAYVFAFEEFNAGYDSNDVVGIVRNVRPADAGPEIGTENLDRNTPGPARLAFNRIQVQPPTGVVDGQTVTLPNNVVHNVATVRVHNSGSAPLTLTSVALSDATNYRINTADLDGSVIAPGGSKDIEVQFIATGGRVHDATLTINSDDADEPATVVALSGYWQNRSENAEEPTFPELLGIFGIGTRLTNEGETLNLPGDEGKVRRTGDEVLSPFWRRADAARAVEVVQLNAFHTHNTEAALKWHYQPSTSTTTIFTHAAVDAQSILPHLKNSDQVAGGTFKPATQGGDTNPAFGFRVDQEWSDPTRNAQEKPGGGYGHHLRFWALRDAAGNVVPDAYLLGMDYQGINYDYQDNLYLIRNVRPAAAPAVPTNVRTAAAAGTGVTLDWDDSPDADLAGYNVYRSTTTLFGPGAAAPLNGGTPLATSTFVDATAAPDVAYFYRVVAVDNDGLASAASDPAAAATIVTDPDSGTEIPGASVSDVSASEPTTGPGTLTFIVTLDAAPTTSPLTLTYATADGTATAGSDYTAATATITFNPGETTKTVDVVTAADTDAEDAETVLLNIAASTGDVVIADAQGVGTLLDAALTGLTFGGKTRATFPGADGRPVRVGLKGPGSGQVVLRGDGAAVITVTGTTAASAISLAGGGTLGGVRVDGPLRSFAAKAFDLAGDFAVAGALGSLRLRNVAGGRALSIGAGGASSLAFANVSDLSVTSASPLRAVKATQWLDADATPDVIAAPAVASVAVRGDFAADVATDQLGKLTARGAIAGSRVRATGSIGTVRAAALRDSTIFAGVRGDLATLPTAPADFTDATAAIRSVSVNPRLAGAFGNALIAAPTIGRLSLGQITAANNGVPFGVAANDLGAVAGATGADPESRIRLSRLTDPADSVERDDFILRLL